MENLKKYLNTSIKDCSLSIDECNDVKKKHELQVEKKTYESVLNYINTFCKKEKNVLNVRENELKKCIFITLDDFEELIDTLTNGLKEVNFEFSVYITDSDKADDEDTYWEEDILETLSKYFGVEVTSYHSDDCDCPCVWICYK
jgi:hypothetical protein